MSKVIQTCSEANDTLKQYVVVSYNYNMWVFHSLEKDGEDGEWTESELMFIIGDKGESGAKLEDEDGGREECSNLIGLCSSKWMESDVVLWVVGVELLVTTSEDEEELFLMCVLKCRVIISRLQAEYGHCGHLYGFSPVCVLWWVLKWSDLDKCII